MIIFTCLRCGFQGREFQKWATHLWEARHQEVVRKSFLNWGDEDNFKSLVVYSPSEVPPPLPSQILEMFHGKLEIMVEDFVCWTNIPRMFIAKLATGEVDRVLQLLRQQSEDLKFGGLLCQLRRKSDVLKYEWEILVRSESAQEATLQAPLVIDIDDSDQVENGGGGGGRGKTRTRKSRGGGDGSSSSSDEDETSGSELEPEPELVQQTNGQSPSTSTSGSQASEGHEEGRDDDDEEEEASEEVKIRTKMSSRFAKIFLSKIKPEKDIDDKGKMKGNLRWMEQQWTDIYLGFHDKLWPVCFAMGNSEMVGRKDKSVGFEVTFNCTTRKSDSNKWLKKKIEKKDFNEVVDGQVEDFYNLLCNETECNRIRKHLKPSDDKPVLGFTCHIVILYHNKHDTTAELRFSQFKGKDPTRKMRAVQAIFNKLFKQYEKMKIDKWNASVKENTPRDCKEWTQIINIE